MSQRSAFTPAWLDEAKLDVYEFRVYCHINRRGTMYGSQSVAAEMCGMSVRRYRTALRTLEEKGLVVTSKQHGRTTIVHSVVPRHLMPDTPARGADKGTPYKGTSNTSSAPDADVTDELPEDNLLDWMN